MRVWLDDMRSMPPDYDIHIKTAQEAIDLLQSGNVTHISLDHDLGDDITFTTGYDVARTIEEMAYEGTPCWLSH